MRNKVRERLATYNAQHVLLGDKRVADIVITNHAKMRYRDRIKQSSADYSSNIAGWAWERLKKGNIKPYYRKEEDVYLIDDDLVMVAEFADLPDRFDAEGRSLHRMIIVTFLGRMSETIELRDLKSYYSWLRHSRRMTLMKNSRKRR
jgi:hypothetical protein